MLRVGRGDDADGVRRTAGPQPAHGSVRGATAQVPHPVAGQGVRRHISCCGPPSQPRHREGTLRRRRWTSCKRCTYSRRAVSLTASCLLLSPVVCTSPAIYIVGDAVREAQLMLLSIPPNSSKMTPAFYSAFCLKTVVPRETVRCERGLFHSCKRDCTP